MLKVYNKTINNSNTYVYNNYVCDVMQWWTVTQDIYPLHHLETVKYWQPDNKTSTECRQVIQVIVTSKFQVELKVKTVAWVREKSFKITDTLWDSSSSSQRLFWLQEEAKIKQFLD